MASPALMRIGSREFRTGLPESSPARLLPTTLHLCYSACTDCMPVSLRIRFRSLCFVFKCLIGLAPAYLQSLFTMYGPRQSLRSSADTRLLEVPLSKFPYISSVWNGIPLSIRHSVSLASFRKALKLVSSYGLFMICVIVHAIVFTHYLFSKGWTFMYFNF